LVREVRVLVNEPVVDERGSRVDAASVGSYSLGAAVGITTSLVLNGSRKQVMRASCARVARLSASVQRLLNEPV